MNRLTHMFLLAGLALVAFLLAAGWAPAPQEGRVVALGQVTNGTPGGSVPAGLPVTLHVFSGLGETGTYTTTVAAGGSFRFDGLSLDEGQNLVARVVYQDVAYFSDLCTIEPGQQELSCSVTIYEITADPAGVLVTQLHIFLTRVEDDLQVGEYYLVSNTGDRAYVGVMDPGAGRRATLTFTLPEGVEGLGFDGPGLWERFLEREGGFADTRPVLPGTATVEVVFRYLLSYREGLRVERVFDVPVASVVLVLPEGDVTLEGEGITPAGTLDTEMGPALSYTAGPLAAREPLVFTLVTGPRSGSATPAGAMPARNARLETALGLVALAAAIVAVYLLWRSPASRPLPARARPLVEAMAALDADFEAGRVAEGVYHQERRALKQRLRVIVEGGGAGEQGSKGAEGQGSGGAVDESEANSQS